MSKRILSTSSITALSILGRISCLAGCLIDDQNISIFLMAIARSLVLP